MKLNSYPKYKESGVEWLGEVPVDWKLYRVGDLADLVNGAPFDSSLFSPDGDHPLIRIRDLNKTSTETRYTGDYDRTVEITHDDVLIGMDGEFNVGRWYGKEIALLNQRVCCIRTKSKSLARILEHGLVYPLKAINDITYSTTVKHLSSTQIAKIRITLPASANEQELISTFLDRETSKLDTLISKQETLIKLLQEKRQAIISHTVTKGLDSDVLMKDSRVKWLGEVPAHWDVVRTKWLFEIKKVIAGSNDHVVLSITQTGIKVKDIESGEGQLSEDYSKYQLVDVGDFAMNHMDLLTGYVDISKFDGVTSPDYRVFRSRNMKAAYSYYYLYLFQMAYKQRIYYNLGQGVSNLGRWRLPTDEFNNYKLPLPPVYEQMEICEYLTREIRKIDSLIDKSRQSISLAKEHRSALISAAVTGKIDLREAT